eukprot:c23012_g2_i1 orf=577-2313(+)
MGCSSSKHAQQRAGKESSGAPLPRTVSMPIYPRSEMQGLPSTTGCYGILTMDGLGADVGSFGLKQDLTNESDVLSSWSRTDSSRLTPVKEEDEGKIGLHGPPEIINTWELMAGLEDGPSPSPLKRTPSPLRRRLLVRSLSSCTVQEMDACLAKMGTSNAQVWRKYLQGDEFGKENATSMDGGSSPAIVLSKQRFEFDSPRRKQNKVGLEKGQPSSQDWVDANAGLRWLLSPSAQSSVSCSSSTGATLFKKTSLTGRTDPSLDSERLSTAYKCDSCLSDGLSSKSPLKISNTPSKPGWMASSDSFRESNSPLFDPAIIATFEQALEAVSEDDWRAANRNGFTSSSSSENTGTSSESSSDADSPHVVASQKSARLGCLWNDKELFDPGNQEKADGVYVRKQSLPKVLPLDHYEEKDWKALESLETFQVRCPPGGEDKVVLYFTSLRGVRKTFENCCNLRLILQGLRVHVDERDVWMHSKFRQELTELLGRTSTVPRLFIKGRYIGGAEEVKLLHEEGILVKLLEGLPTDASREACDGCGDVRFVPCLTCSGSCKLITEDNVVVRCPDCNENGLIMCPICS